MSRHTISRRSLLAGLGAGGVLLSGLSRTLRAEPDAPPLRAAFLFHANGSHREWTPAGGDGSTDNLTWSPHLRPLDSVREDVLILRNLRMQRFNGNPHRKATESVLGAGSSGPGQDYRPSVRSFDQLLADHTEGTTPLKSLEMSIGFTGGVGGIVHSLSQRDGRYLHGERNPVAAFQRVAQIIAPDHVGGDDGAMRLLHARKSLLDYLKDDVSTFRNRLGNEEKPKLDMYLQSLRELENALTGVVKDPANIPACQTPTPPPRTADYEAGINDIPRVGRLYLDIMALALACGVTRVSSMMWGGGENNEAVRFEAPVIDGVGGLIDMDNWHSFSHLDPSPDEKGGRNMIRMQNFFCREFAYFVDKLKSFPDADGSSVLDNSVVLWGTQCGNTTQSTFDTEDHNRNNTPVILAGRGGGAIQPGRMIDCKGASQCDLYVSIAHAFGLNVNQIGEASWNSGALNLT